MTTSVNGYVRGIEKKTNEVNAGAKAIAAGAKAIVEGIKEQERINTAAVAEIGRGVAHLQSSIKAFTNQMNSYTKAFWFGSAAAKEQ